MEVVGADDPHGFPTATPPATAQPGSPLEILRGKRQALHAGLHLDLAVPRWEQVLGCRLWVRYGPGSPSVLANAIEKAEATKEKDPDWLVIAHATFLVEACQAVYTLPLDIERPPADIPGLDDYPQFGPELAEALDVPVRSAVAVARALYATDGDLMVAAQQLAEWSAQAAGKAETDFLAS